MVFHIIAFLAGFILDLIFGDPYSIPHPVRFIGKLISFFEEKLIGSREDEDFFMELTDSQKRFRGFLEVIFVCAATELPVILLLVFGYKIHPVFGCTIEAIMTYQLLAMKSLKDESMKVYAALEYGTLEEARTAVSAIVGRDTENLTDEEVTKAAVETVAENASDGVIAPMLFLALGGPVLGFLEKCINTMDSMIGYKNERYYDFGFCAAKADDIVNFIPARVSAVLMILACAFLGKDFSFFKAALIYKRDRKKHASPNSAHTESVCAGALGIRLAGPAAYEGILEEKPYIGEAFKDVEHKDIINANKLLYAAGFLCELLCIAALIAVGAF